MDSSPKIVLYGALLFEDRTIPFEQQLSQVLDSPCTTVELWPAHIWYNPDRDFSKPAAPRIYYNNTIMVDENGVFNTDLAYLAGFIDALRQSGRTISFGIGAEGNDFSAVQQLLKEQSDWELLSSRFQTLFDNLEIDSIDLDMEESYRSSMQKTIVELTVLLGKTHGKSITYCPYCEHEFWFGCLADVFDQEKEQYVESFNLQCYGHDTGNTTVDWAERLSDFNVKRPTGVADTSKFMVPGYWATVKSGGPQVTPGKFREFFAEKSIRTDAAGGFIWNSLDIWKQTTNTIADYGQAIVSGLEVIKLSVFDLLKIGIGPSSSHTLAPWLAARDCYGQIKDDLESLDSVRVDLYGSLAYVGRGHYTTIALPLGLLNQDPGTFNISEDLGILGSDIHDVRDIDKVQSLDLPRDSTGSHRVNYNKVLNFEELDEPEKIVFSFTWTSGGTGGSSHARPDSLTYYSYGGGSWGREPPPQPPLYPDLDPEDLSYPYGCADGLLDLLHLRRARLSDAIFQNELVFAEHRGKPNGESSDRDPPKSGLEIVPHLKQIAEQMGNLIFSGFTHSEDDICYQPMYAKPKAKKIFSELFGAVPCPVEEPPDWTPFLEEIRLRSEGFGFDKTMKLVGTMALAVAEQNAALKNVVTAPTNGACGVVPALLYYYVLFHAPESERSWLFNGKPDGDGTWELNNICRFLLVANAVGGIVKANANIAGGLGGCQAEIGTASAMAAGALTEVLGGSPTQVFRAAEAALETHLGLICDPVGGLVEIPCIGRNQTAAMTAISVALEFLALDQGFETRVSFDKTVETMENVSNKMSPDYKESSTGGLAKTMRGDVWNRRPDLFSDEAKQMSEGRISVFRTTC